MLNNNIIIMYIVNLVEIRFYEFDLRSPFHEARIKRNTEFDGEKII